MLYLVNVEAISSSINTPPVASSIIPAQDVFLKPEKTIIKEKGVTLTRLNKAILKDSKNDFDVQPLPPTIEFDAEPMALLSMPVGISVQAHIILVIDPDNIYIRLCSWVL